MRKIVSVLCLLAVITGCSPNVESRGHVLDEGWQSLITPGVSSQDEVRAALGSPSSVSTFGQETWYYVHAKRESYAFLKPEVSEQDVVRITFGPDGTVDKVDDIDESKAKDFAVVKRTTPTEGHQMGFVEQVLGNLGRFNSPSGTGAHSSMGRRAGGI